MPHGFLRKLGRVGTAPEFKNRCPVADHGGRFSDVEGTSLRGWKGHRAGSALT